MSTRPTRLPMLLVLLAAAAAPVAPAAGQERARAEDLPWEGILPDPYQAGMRTDDADRPEWYAVLVRDMETGAPIPGAKLLRTPEAISPRRVRHDMVMGVGVADADGIARVPAATYQWNEDCNWLAVAEGYAPEHDYGVVPDAEFSLRRGQPFRARVLDPTGRPVAGALVEWLGGCSHGTAGLRSVAGPDGLVSFACARPTHGQLWIAGAGISHDLVAFDTPLSLGREPCVLAMDTGHRYVGRVVDLLGEPVAGAVVRHYNEQRGPATTTDRDGRFVLEGVERDVTSLLVCPPLDLIEDEGALRVEDAVPGVPMTVVLSPLGVFEEEKSARIRVRSIGPDGAPAGSVGYRMLRADTGRGPWGLTEDEPSAEDDGPALGEADEKVAAGTYRVVPLGPLQAFEFDPVEVTAAAGKTARVTVTARPRPVLRIRGEFPNATLTISAAGHSEWEHADATWSPPLPAEGPAVLRVEIKGRPPFFFPVGPVKEGVREVVVSLPKPRRLLLPAGVAKAELLDGERDAAFVRDGDAIATDAVGVLTLRWTDKEGRTRNVPVDLPEAPGAEVRIDVAAGAEFHRECPVRVLGPGDDGKEKEFEVVTRYPGQELKARRDGWRTLRWTPAAGDVLRYGNCRITLTVRVEGEAPAADVVALVDGELYEVEEGRLDLGGFEPGPHRILVNLGGRLGGGREIRVTLAPGETWEGTTTLEK